MECFPVSVEVVVRAGRHPAAGGGQRVVAGVGVVEVSSASVRELHDLLARRLPLLQHLLGRQDGALAAVDHLVQPDLKDKCNLRWRSNRIEHRKWWLQ